MWFHLTSNKYLKILQQKVVEKEATKQIKEVKRKKEKKKRQGEWQNHLIYNTTNNQKIGWKMAKRNFQTKVGLQPQSWK